MNEVVNQTVFLLQGHYISTYILQVTSHNFSGFLLQKKSVACTFSSGACFCGSIPLQPPPFNTFSTHQITLIKNHRACSIMLRCSYIQSINGFALFRFLFLLLLISKAFQSTKMVIWARFISGFSNVYETTFGTSFK